MPARALLLLGLLAGARAVRRADEELSLEEDEGAAADAQASANASAGPSASTRAGDYWVFVKAYKILEYKKMKDLAWHTETLFCEMEHLKWVSMEAWLGTLPASHPILKEPHDKQEAFFKAMPALIEQAKDLLDDKVTHRRMTAKDMEAVKDFVGRCWVTGYTNIGPFDATFHDEEPRFYNPEVYRGEFWLLYAGHVTGLNIESFFKAHAMCGAWAWQSYRFLRHNCNHYTNSLMKGLHLPELSTLLWQADSEKPLTGSWLPELLLKKPKLPDPGRYDLAAKTCKGVKCVGPMPEDVYGLEDVAMMEEDPECSAGICHDGGTYDKETRTCA